MWNQIDRFGQNVQDRVDSVKYRDWLGVLTRLRHVAHGYGYGSANLPPIHQASIHPVELRLSPSFSLRARGAI